MQVTINTGKSSEPMFEIFKHSKWFGLTIGKFTLSFHNEGRGWYLPAYKHERFVKRVIADHSASYGICHGRCQLVLDIDQRKQV